MKRLRETEADSPLLQTARALLDSAPPLADSDERKQRVRRALDRKEARGGPLRKAPALVIAGLVALFGASAFAAVRYMAARSAAEEVGGGAAAEHGKRSGSEAKRVRGAETQTSTSTSTSTSASTGASTGVGASVRVSAGAESVAAVVETSEPAAEGGSRAEASSVGAGAGVAIAAKAKTAVPAGRVRRSAKSARRSVAEPVAAEETEEARRQAEESDSALVHRAVQALRRDHDPALAAQLLAEHRGRSLRGPLAEEALSLQIEAASALGNGRAAWFAREYLTLYPNGRYTKVARKALAEP